MLVAGLKPVAYLVLGYGIENMEQVHEGAVWVNLRDMAVTLREYVARKSLPFKLTMGHVRAAILMLEGGYITIERDTQETGRNLEHPFKLRVNASGKAYFKQLEQEVGYPLKKITGS